MVCSVLYFVGLLSFVRAGFCLVLCWTTFLCECCFLKALFWAFLFLFLLFWWFRAWWNIVGLFFMSVSLCPFSVQLFTQLFYLLNVLFLALHMSHFYSECFPSGLFLWASLYATVILSAFILFSILLGSFLLSVHLGA